MKRLMYIIFGMTLISLIGCQTNSAIEEDELSAWEKENTAEVESVLNADEDLNFDALDDGSEENIDVDDPNWLGGSSLNKTSETRIRFGRIRKHLVEKNIQVIFDTDTTATAYVYTKIKGIFVVFKATADSGSVSYHRFEKPMTHEVERIVHLKKVRDTELLRLNWKIVDISLKNGVSPDATVEIVELAVMPSGLDSVTITDPLDYFMNGTNMFIFPRFTEVKLRVTVQNTSANKMEYPEGTEATEIVRLHYGRNRMGHFARQPFIWVGKDDFGNNVYEGLWTVRQYPGIHHAVIDVINNGTILSSDNDLYPYNSNTWASPYRVSVF